MDLAVCLRNEPVQEVVRVARFAEDHGYRELWLPDSARGAGVDEHGRLTGRDAFCALSAMFGATNSLTGGIGVAATPMHTPTSLALVASTLAEMSGGRFQLGLGVSHRELAERNGVPFPDHPVDHMRAYATEMRQRSASGMSFGGGWQVLLAALGPKMIQVAIDEADGVVLNWLTAASVARTVDQARQADGTTRTVLYLRLMMPELARQDAVDYDRLGNYHRHFRAQGLSDPDEIVEQTTVPADDIGAARDRIEAYRAAGVDVLCLYAVGLEPAHRDRLLATLAG